MQLRGRCARQGDPGSSKFYIAFEDSLMRLFASPKLTTFLQRFRPPEGEPISAKVLNRSIETAQKRVEQRNYSIRKHTLEYDDVMNKQRKEVYSFRNEILHEAEPIQLAKEVLESICREKADEFFVSQTTENGWNTKGYAEYLMTHFPITFEENAFDDEYLTVEAIETIASEKILAALQSKLDQEAATILAIQKSGNIKPDPLAILQDIIRSILLRNIDRLWQDHLLSIDHLRTEVTLRAIGQKDPLVEFKHEAFALFNQFSQDVKLKIGHGLFKFEMMPPQPEPSKRPIDIGHYENKRASLFSSNDPLSKLALRSSSKPKKKS